MFNACTRTIEQSPRKNNSDSMVKIIKNNNNKKSRSILFHYSLGLYTETESYSGKKGIGL